MEKFFAKHVIEPSERDALRMVHDRIEKALHKHKHMKGDKYLREMAEAYEMIGDFFEAKGMDAATFFED